MPFPP